MLVFHDRPVKIKSKKVIARNVFEQFFNYIGTIYSVHIINYMPYSNSRKRFKLLQF